MTHRPTRRIALSLALVAAAALAHGADVKLPEAPLAKVAPPPALSKFQWTLLHGSELMLVPVDGVYYPARLAEEGVIETLPVKLRLSLHHDNTELVLPVTEVLAPWEALGEDWIVERRRDKGWSAVGTAEFENGTFHLKAADGQTAALAPGEIRFRRR